MSFITFVILNILFLNLFPYNSFLSIYTVFYVYIGNYASYGRLFYLFRRSLILQFNSNGLLKFSINILFVTIEFLKNFKWHFDGCLTYNIQARRFAARSSTRQTTHLNSDKKVNSKPSETGRSPLNRLANRPLIFRAAAYFELYSFYIFRVFIAPLCFGRRFSCAVLFYCSKTPFSVLFEYDFTP